MNTLLQHEWDALIGSIIKRYRHICGDDALISFDDLQQEAWIALLNAAQKYDPANKNGAKFSTFAYQRIQYHLCDYISRKIESKPTQVSGDPFDYAEDNEFIDESVQECDLMDTIFAAVADEQYVHLLREHFLEGKSYRTLAEKYQCSHETIGSRIHKLLAMLEKRISKDNE